MRTFLLDNMISLDSDQIAQRDNAPVNKIYQRGAREMLTRRPILG